MANIIQEMGILPPHPADSNYTTKSQKVNVFRQCSTYPPKSPLKNSAILFILLSCFYIKTRNFTLKTPHKKLKLVKKGYLVAKFQENHLQISSVRNRYTGAFLINYLLATNLQLFVFVLSTLDRKHSSASANKCNTAHGES